MPSFQAAGRSATLEVARDQRPLEPVAQDDVQRVGHLVGVDADEAALDAGVEALEVRRREGGVVAERLLELARQKAHERRRTAGLHLDEQRLALVDGHAALVAHRLAAPAQRQPGLVEGVTGLVQHAHQGRDELVLAVAGGDADVVGGAAAERVRALVEPAGVEVEAQPGHQRAGRAPSDAPPGTGRPEDDCRRGRCLAMAASTSGGSSAARRSNSSTIWSSRRSGWCASSRAS